VFGVDVTELVRARAQAEAARREAEKANAAKGRFLAATSHDLRSPLNAIAGYTELLEQQTYGPITDQQRHALSRLAHAQQHLLTLIDDILQVARHEAGQARLAMVDFPLAELCGLLEPLVWTQAAAKRLAYACDFTSHATALQAPLYVRADRHRVLQILVNLVTNAVKHTPEGGAVTVNAAADAAHVHVRVHDTGRGIPADQLEAIFHPFVQGEHALETAAGDGVGLGLAISRELAREMGGDVTVQSEVGVGSTFTLTLPRAHDH
jgi:signal transduction histidine kinase